jgi:hypothetical protein
MSHCVAHTRRGLPSPANMPCSGFASRLRSLDVGARHRRRFVVATFPKSPFLGTLRTSERVDSMVCVAIERVSESAERLPGHQPEGVLDHGTESPFLRLTIGGVVSPDQVPNGPWRPHRRRLNPHWRHFSCGHQSNRCPFTKHLLKP